MPDITRKMNTTYNQKRTIKLRLAFLPPKS